VVISTSHMKDKLIVSVDFVGSDTQTPYRGEFTVKTKLSWREMIKEDEIRRSVLGFNAAEAGELAARGAQFSAYLVVRVTEAPDWWKKSNNGLDSEDINLLSKVYDAVSEKIEAEYKRVADEAEKAKQDLKPKE
jgi:hypothetical protein